MKQPDLTYCPFSPDRSPDGHFSSCLLRAMAQLRSQLRAHFSRVPSATPPSKSAPAWCWLGGALLGPVVLYKHPRLYLLALCEAREAPPAHPIPRVTQSQFNWQLFWHFLRPYLLLLGAAIVVRLSPPLHPGDRGDLAAQGSGQPEASALRLIYPCSHPVTTVDHARL